MIHSRSSSALRCCTLAFLAASTALQAAEKGLVSTENSRTSLLDSIEVILAPAADDLAQRVQSLPTPFAERRIEPVEGYDAGEAAPQVARELPDAVVLDAALRSFRPTGSMIGPRSSILNIGGGQSIQLGQTFNVTIQGVSYPITVSAITTEGYSLRYGTAEGSRTFLQNRLGADASIERDAASDASTPPPGNP